MDNERRSSKRKEKKSAVIVAIITGVFSIITTILSAYLGYQLDSIANQTQQINISVINALGKDTIDEMNISATSDISYVTEELTRTLLYIEQENKELKQQLSSLKEFIINEHPSNDVDRLVSEGYIKETPAVRLDQLEYLDGEYYKEVPSVKDLYGTTHSTSYRMAADYSRIAWAKFKLDNQYDYFSANVITSKETARKSCMSVEVYVDNNLVCRVDDVMRDEILRPISANVSGGNVLMIKVIGFSNIEGNICFITDTELTQLG